MPFAMTMLLSVCILVLIFCSVVSIKKVIDLFKSTPDIREIGTVILIMFIVCFCLGVAIFVWLWTVGYQGD